MDAAPTSTVGRALRRRHWMVWGTAAVACALAFAATHVRHPTYEATALLSLDETQNVNQGFDLALQADQYLTQRYIAMATSQAVLQPVCAIESPPCDPGALSRQVAASTPKTAGLIAITVRASRPATAARLANEIANEVLARNSSVVTAYLAPQREYLQKQLDQLNGQISGLQKSLQGIQNDYRWDPELGGLMAPQLSQLNTLQTQYSSTYTRMQDLDVLQTRLASVLSIEELAAPPTTPSDPDLVRYLLVGGAGGLAFGFLAALVAERYRGRVHDGADLAEATGSPLVLAVDGREPNGIAGPYGLLAQADLLGGSESPQVALVAASTGEPVDEVAMSLARAASTYDRRVLVIPTSPAALEGPAPAHVPATGSSEIVVRSRASGGGLRPGQEGGPSGKDEFDVTIRSVPVPVWLKPGAGAVFVVATRGRTRFRDARSTSMLLRRAGIEPAAAILLSRDAADRLRAHRSAGPAS